MSTYCARFYPWTISLFQPLTGRLILNQTYFDRVYFVRHTYNRNVSRGFLAGQGSHPNGTRKQKPGPNPRIGSRPGFIILAAASSRRRKLYFCDWSAVKWVP
jgi:hypothetical protein